MLTLYWDFLQKKSAVLLKFVFKQEKIMINTQCDPCWRPANVRRRGTFRHGIDLVSFEYSFAPHSDHNALEIQVLHEAIDIHIDGLVQDGSISSSLAMQKLPFYAKLSLWGIATLP